MSALGGTSDDVFCAGSPLTLQTVVTVGSTSACKTNCALLPPVERRGRRNGTSAESIQQEVGTLGKVTAIPEEPVVFASPSSVDFDCLQVLRLSFAHDARCVLLGHSNDLDARV